MSLSILYAFSRHVIQNVKLVKDQKSNGVLVIIFLSSIEPAHIDNAPARIEFGRTFKRTVVHHVKKMNAFCSTCYYIMIKTKTI